MHEIDVAIRFCETDLLGHVNNNSFFVYMEDSRIQFFRDLEAVGKEWNFIVASIQCDFIRQVYFGQTLNIRSHVTRIGNSSFHLAQELYEKESGELVAKGKSVIVQFDFNKQVNKPLSEELKERLSSFCLTPQEK